MFNVGAVNDFVPTLIGAGRYIGVIKKTEAKESERTGRFYAKLNILIQEVEKGTMVQARETGEVNAKSKEPIVEWDEAVDPKSGKVINPEGEYLNLTLFYAMEGDKIKYHDKQMALLKGLLKAIDAQTDLPETLETDTEEFVKLLEGLRVGVKISKPKIYTQNEDDKWVLTDYPGNDIQGFFKAE